MISTPFIGFVYKVDIFEPSEADDGAGGLAVTVGTKVVSAVKCRIWPFTVEEQRDIFGDFAEERFGILLKGHNALYQRDYFVKQTSGSKASPLNSSNVYKITYVPQKRFELFGEIHHTTVYVEYEEGLS